MCELTLLYDTGINRSAVCTAVGVAAEGLAKVGLTSGGVSNGGGSICQRSGYLSDGGGGICDGGSKLSDCGGGDYGWGNSFRDYCGFTVDDSVESIDRVSGVLDGTTSSVRLHQAVAALDDVSVAGLLLSLGVASQSVLDVVSVAVLRVRVVVSVDGHRGGDLSDGGGGIGKGSGDLGDGCGIGEGSGDLGDWGGIGEGSCSGGGISYGGRSQSWSAVSQRCTGGHDGWGANDPSAGDGHQGGEGEELLEKNRRLWLERLREAD